MTRDLLFKLIIALFFCYACSSNTEKSDAQQPVKMANYDTVQASEVDFTMNIVAPEDPRFNDIYNALLEEDALQRFINQINKRIEFPGEVAIEIAQCDEDNAFYSADSSKITICYEFIEHALAIQTDESLSMGDKLLNAVGFTFLHEMGHALVDKLDLPITGKEENAVDELAMVVLMSDTTDETYFAAIEGAMQFYEFSLDDNIKNFPFYDAHAPDIERYYDMLAIIVGAEPETAKDYVGENDKFKLHPDRAATAEQDYQKKLDSWKRLLGDAWKN